MGLDAAFEHALRRCEEVEFDRLPKHERVLVALWSIEAEVNNGGFDQFYFNRSGDYALFVPEALRLLGAPRMAAVAECANALFGTKGPPRDWSARQEALLLITDEDDELFDELDREFQAYPEDLAALAEAYVRANFVP